MKIKNVSVIISFFLLLSCSEKKQDSGVIKADVSKLSKDFDKVVITMWGFKQLGDSIKTVDTIGVKEGKFEYHFKVKEPKYTFIYFIKNNKEVAHLGFKDKYGKKESFRGDLLVGNENIELKTNNLYKVIESKGIKYFKVDFEGSPEADMDMRGMLGKIVSKENIKQNPSNYALFYRFFWNKEKCTVDQLRQYSALFSDDLKKSVSYSMLQDYINNKEKLEKIGFRDSFNWVDIHNKNYTFDQVSNGKPVLLIFWASWCGPCRMEIPELKKFNETYKEKVSIVSLSIDENYDKWKTAVDQENMPWLNLSGLPKSNNAIKQEYNILAVPTLILLDKNGKIIITVINDLPLIIKTINALK